MKPNDILMKKWCFGIGRARKMVRENNQGEAETVVQYPKYRTIAIKVISAKKGSSNKWQVKAEQYSSLTGKPKEVNIVLNEQEKNGHIWYTIDNQKRVWHKIKSSSFTEEGVPPVGSLITVNKKHGLITEVGRNQLTVYVNGKYESIAFKPGTIKWHSDKILKSMV